jgi:hypothetical protein
VSGVGEDERRGGAGRDGAAKPGRERRRPDGRGGARAKAIQAAPSQSQAKANRLRSSIAAKLVSISR